MSQACGGKRRTFRNHTLAALLSVFLLHDAAGNLVAQTLGAPSGGLAQAVLRELQITCYDPQDCIPTDVRLLRLGEQRAISEILLELATQFRGARKGEPEYYLRIRSLSVLGVWKSVEALPMLLEGVASEDEEVRIRSVLAIGQIDAAANKAVLLRALRDEYFPVRAAAAKGLSQTEDPQVLLELEVQASRERSRGAWREILESATLLRERIAGKGK